MDLYHITSQEVLDRISRHCPEAMSTYLLCINHVNKNGKHHFSKEQIQVDLSQSFCTFRNNIRKLARENLLEWHLINNGISVILAEIDDE